MFRAHTTPKGLMVKKDGAEHLKRPPEVITLITNCYTPKLETIDQAKRLELQKQHNLITVKIAGCGTSTSGDVQT